MARSTQGRFRRKSCAVLSVLVRLAAAPLFMGRACAIAAGRGEVVRERCKFKNVLMHVRNCWPSKVACNTCDRMRLQLCTRCVKPCARIRLLRSPLESSSRGAGGVPPMPHAACNALAAGVALQPTACRRATEHLHTAVHAQPVIEEHDACRLPACGGYWHLLCP